MCNSLAPNVNNSVWVRAERRRVSDFLCIEMFYCSKACMAVNQYSMSAVHSIIATLPWCALNICTGYTRYRKNTGKSS